VGDKYKLLPQLSKFFPQDLDRIIEPFVGGGSIFLNSNAPEVLANDLNSHVIEIHKLLYLQGDRMEQFISKFRKLAKSYELTCSFDGESVPEDVKKKYPKTYFAHLNRQGYSRLREKFNNSSSRDTLELYALMIYGFNRMLRFNSAGDFNIPVGNVDLNANVVGALHEYSNRTAGRKVIFSNLDFESFLKSIEFRVRDFVYVDPPYLITSSEYNKGWDDSCELRLYEILDYLNSLGVKFALSNVEIYGDKNNPILEEWMKKYHIHVISSNYINYFNNGKKMLKEVLVCNYE
jgi:DNA adenine methylase